MSRAHSLARLLARLNSCFLPLQVRKLTASLPSPDRSNTIFLCHARTHALTHSLIHSLQLMFSTLTGAQAHGVTATTRRFCRVDASLSRSFDQKVRKTRKKKPKSTFRADDRRVDSGEALFFLSLLMLTLLWCDGFPLRPPQLHLGSLTRLYPLTLSSPNSPTLVFPH